MYKIFHNEDDEKTPDVNALLKEVVEWWDNWNTSNTPTEVANPPIEEIRKYLQTIK